MSETAGRPESSPPRQDVNTRAAELDRELDELEHRHGLLVGLQEDEVTTETRRLMALPPSALSAMTWAQLSEGAVVLRQAAIRLQQSSNRASAKMNWARECANKIVSQKLGNYNAYGFEERRLVAVNDNDAAAKFEAVRVAAQMRADRMLFLSNKVSAMADALTSLSNGKRGQRD